MMTDPIGMDKAELLLTRPMQFMLTNQTSTASKKRIFANQYIWVHLLKLNVKMEKIFCRLAKTSATILQNNIEYRKTSSNIKITPFL